MKTELKITLECGNIPFKNEGFSVGIYLGGTLVRKIQTGMFTESSALSAAQDKLAEALGRSLDPQG